MAPEITGNDSRETVGYSDDTDHNADNADSNTDNADSNADNADKGKEIEKIKLDIQKVFGVEKQKTPTKLFVNKNVNVFQKGDHVLISGVKRKLPALLGDKVNSDDSDSEEYVEVNFFTKTKEKGWRMLDVIHVVKMSEVEKKIEPPKITHVSRTRCFLEFEELHDLSVSEGSDTSFDI